MTGNGKGADCSELVIRSKFYLDLVLPVQHVIRNTDQGPACSCAESALQPMVIRQRNAHNSSHEVKVKTGQDRTGQDRTGQDVASEMSCLELYYKRL